jgi:3-methyl-2-oxobutanoate hydroxymethyltransferase
MDNSYTNGHIPRHARIYRDFKRENARLQVERVNAFREYHEDTVNKKFNDPKITVGIDDKEFENFLKLSEKL